jgi:hypothetical protein
MSGRMRGWLFGLAAILAIQVLRMPVRNGSAQDGFEAPPEVRSAVLTACFQCHSERARWPWYTQIAPVSWFVHAQVEEARKRLNFSSWKDYLYDPGTAAQKFGAINQMVRSGTMPPWYFRTLSARGRLTAAQRAAIETWAIEGRARALKAEPN